MNAPVLLAQLAGSTTQTPQSPKNLKLEKPQNGQAISVHLDGNTKLDFADIASEKLTFVRVGEKLIILFDNQSTVTVDPVFDSMGKPLTDLAFDMGSDRTLTGEQFAQTFPITTDQSVLPAAGGATGPTGGANFGDATVGALGASGARLALLTGEDTGGGFDPLEDGTPNPSPIPGGVTAVTLNEDGFAEGNLGGTGDTGGTATSVTGSLNVDFGTDGSNRSFAFSLNQPTLAGLTSDGQTVQLAFTTVNGQPVLIGYVGGDFNVAANQVFTVSLDASSLQGSYTFTLLRPLDHPIHGTEDTINLSINVIATDGSGDTVAVAIPIGINDDTPVIGTPADAALTDPLSGNPATQTGSLGISWGADRYNDHVDGGVSATTGATGDRSVVFANTQVTAAGDGTTAIGTLTSHGETVHYVLLENGTVLVAYTGDTAPTSLASLQQSGTPSGEGEGGEGGIANNVVFVVTLSDASNSGSYVVTQYRSLDHDNGSATFQNIDLAFNFTVTDSDGDTVNGTLHAVIADTVPVVTGPADASTLSEGNGETPPSEGGEDMPSLLVVGGSFTPKDTGAVSLHIDWRSDNQNPNTPGATHDRSVTFTAATQTALENLGLTSDGATIIYTISADGTLLTATTAATEGHSARTIFTVQLSDSGNGSYDFALLDNLDHRGSSEGSQALTFGFIATDSDGDSTAPANFTVNITDETPSFTSEGVAPQFVDEEGNAGDTYASGDLAGEAKTATASLNIAWGADDANNVVDGGFTGSAGDRSVVFASNAVSSLQAQNLTSNGVALQYILSTDGTTLTAYQGSGRLDGDKVFTVTLSDQGNGSYNFTMLGHLDHPISGVEDDLTPVFNFTARDADGDAISSSFSVTINDDAPVVPVTTPVNLIVNGDFSAGDWSGVASWGNYSTNVTGWTITGDRLERVNSGYLGATLPNGGHMVDLEASPGDLTLSQTIGDMTTGQTYHLSFAIGEATGPYGAHLEVYWNGTLVGSYSPQTGAMQTIDLTVVADGTSNTLSFKETGAIDNSGTFLANVSLTAAAVGIVDEDGLANGVAGGVGDVAGQATVVTHALNISWGSDNGNSVVDGGITGLPVNGDRAVTFDASNVSALSALGLTHNGTVITYQISADGTKLIASAGEQEIFHVALSDVDSGSYTFTLTGTIDHPLHSVEDNVTLNFAVRATDSDGDSIPTSFAVLVNDDAPSIGKIGDQTIAETTSTEFSNTFLTQTLSDVSLNISWGADDNNSGAFNRSVAFDAALAGTAPSGLTSNGVALIYVLSADGTGLTAYRFDGTNYIGVGGGNLGTSPSDAARVFSVQLSDLGNGSYTFKLYDNLDHKTGDGTSLNLSFGFTATDSDGDTTPVSNFNIVVTDNVPLLVGNADIGALTEAGLPTVSSTFGNLGIDWNADDRGSAHLEFAKDSNGLAIVPQGLTSDGVALAYTVRLAANGVDEELVAYKVGDTVDHPVFIVALNGLVNPAFAATLFQNLDHVGAGNDNSLTLTFTAHAIDGDGDTVDRTFTITVADTKATIGTPASAQADEDAFGNPAGLSLITDSAIDTDNNNRTVGGKLNISWGSDDSNTVVNGGITGAPVAGDRAVTFDASNITTLLGLNLTHNGAALSYQISADGQTLTAKANGEEIFNVKLFDVDSGSYIFTLTRNLDHPDHSGEDNLNLTFKFIATDSDGDATTATFDVAVNDDSPVIGTPASTQADDSALGNVSGLSIITDSSVDTDTNSKTVGGKLNISWGADDGNNLGNVGITGASSVNGDRAVTFDVNATNTALNALHLTHDGTSLVYSYSSGNSLLTAKANGATVFTVQLSDDGSGKYIFTLVDSFDHPTHGTADNLNLTFSFIATDSDGDKATSTFAVAVNDDLPTIGSPAASRVDEDDLSAGNHDGLVPITDVTVDTDSSRLTVGGKLGISWGADDGNSSVNGGVSGASVNGDRAVTFDSATTAALTSQHLSQGGVELTYVISNNGTVLKGMAGTAEVFSVTLSDQNDGSYIFTLKGKLDHPDTTTEDNIDLTFNFTATDSDGDTATSSFKVTVNDDAPTAAGETATVAEASPAVGTGNIILAFDRSGSMSDDPDGSGGFSSRLALAKAAAINLLNTSNADQVLIVTFSDNATSSSWMTKAQAIAYINSNSFPGTNGGTDYDNATAAIQGATIPSGGTSVYFFTDGQPTGSGGLNSTERAAWESFLQSKSMTSYAVGVGNSIGANDPDLNDVAYPGSPLIITTANDPALLGTITPTLPTSVAGNILSNDHFGADGGRILSIMIGSVTYTWNGSSTITKSGGETGTISGNALSIDTGINGHLNFNFSTGAWSYNAPSQLVTNTTETFSYTLIDGDKDTAGANLVISVTAVNDAPTNTVPTARVVNEDTAIVFSSGNNNAISIADADHNGGNETVTLSVLHGNLTLSGLSGLTVTGNGTGNVTVTGTVAAINSALNGLSYLPSDNYNGADTLTIVTNDNGNNGVGGAKSDTDTIAITINPVNDAPVITPETREVSYIENGNDLKLLSNAVITDPDNPTSLNGGFISVTLGNTVAGDQLQIADNSNVRLQGNNVQISNGFGGWTTIGTISAGGFGGTSVTITLNSNADVADVQTVVRSLAFYSSSDNPTGVDRTATITFNDGGHDGSGGALSDSSTVTVHVTPVNDAPVIAGGSERSVSVAENSTAVTTVTSTDPDGGTPTYSIVQTAGTDCAKFTINPVTGALSFVNAPDYENPTDVGGTNGNNTYEVDVRVSDGNGGTAVQTINVTVTNVNEAPVLAPNSNSVSYTENGSALKLMPTASVTDPDSPSSFVGGSITASLGATAVSGDQLVFAGSSGVSLVGNVIWIGFTVVGTVSGYGTSNMTVSLAAGATDGNVETVLKALAYQSTSENPTGADRTVTVTFNDGGNDGSGPALSDTSTVTIHVTPVNDAPVAINDTGSATERGGVANATGGSNATGNVLSNDSDVDDLQTSLVVSGVRVGTAGSTGTVGSTLTGAHGSLVLNANGTYTYVIDETDAQVQALNVNGTITDTFTYTVRDPSGAIDTAQLTITINGANDAPVATDDTGSATEKGGVSNGSGGVTATGNVRTNDSDVDNTTSSLVISAVRTGAEAGTGTAGTVGSSLAGQYGSLKLNSDGSYTYTVTETNSTVQALNVGQSVTETFTYTVRDAGGLTDTAQLVITINGANDAAVITGNVTGSVTEASGVANATPGIPTATGDLNVTDVDNAAIFTVQSNVTTSYGTFSIGADGAWTYNLNNANSTVQGLNNGGTLHDLITVTTADGTSKQIDVTINGANDAAVVSSATVNLTETNSAASISTMGSLTITDVDNPATFVAQNNVNGTYGKFSITSAGAWTYTANNAHDEFQVGQTYTDTFSVSAADGTLTTVVINIAGTNDAPVLTVTNGSSGSIGDGFQSGGYTGSTGSPNLWTTNWTEVGDNNSSSNGDIRISSSGGNSYVRLGDSDGSNSSLQRTVDLSGTSSATLTFDYRRVDLDSSSDQVFVQVSTDGVNFTQIAVIGGGNFDDNGFLSASIDLSAYRSSTTTIRFVASGGLGDSDYVYLDNVNISYSNEPTFTENGSAVAIITNATLSDVDDANMASATVVLTNKQAGDQLWINSTALSNGSTGTVNGVSYLVAESAGAITITFSGAATKAAYELAIEAVKYASTSENPSTTDRSFQITVNDGHDNSNTGTAVVHVIAVNDAPLAVNDTGAATEKGGVANGTGGSNATGNVLSNDTDAETPSASLIVSAVRTGTEAGSGASGTVGSSLLGTYGTLTLNANGSYTYVLNDNNGTVQALNVGGTLTDTFTYTVKDPSNLTDTAQLVITINGTNDVAVISGTITSSVIEAGGVNNAVTGTPTATGMLTDTDVDNTPNTFTAVSVATGTTNGYGTYTMTAGGVWTFTLNNANAAVQALNVGQTLTDTFTAQTVDGTSQAVTVTINGTNDAAVISGTTTGGVIEAGGVSNATAGTPTATGTLTDTDVDNTPNAFQAVSSATGTTNGYGTYTMTAGGVWTYTLNDSNPAVQALNSGNTLTDTFTVKTADGTSQVVTVTINGTNDAAVISGITSGSVIEAGGVDNGIVGTPTATGTLTDTDVDNTPNTFQAVAAGAATTGGYGTYALTAGGVWTYTLNNANPTVQALGAGGVLTDTFTVKTADGTPQVVTVTIHGANDAPVTVNDVYTINEDQILTGVNVLANDSDPEGSTLQRVGNLGGFLGPFASASLTQSGDLTVTPTVNGSGIVVLTYQASDGTLSTQGTITVNVRPVADAAVLTASGGNEDNAFAIHIALGDTDGSEKATHIELSGYPAGTTFNQGSLQGGVWVIDNPAGIDLAHLTATTPTNYNGTFNLGVSVTVVDHATLTTGLVTDTATSTGTIAVTVNPVNDAPVLTADDATLTETAGTDAGLLSTTGNILSNDHDVDGDTLSVKTIRAANGVPTDESPIAIAPGGNATSHGIYGDLVMHSDGSYTYTANAAFDALADGVQKTDVFKYVATDGNGGDVAQYLTVHLTGVNDTPVPVDDDQNLTDTAAIDAGTVKTFAGSVLANDHDAENDPLTVITIRPDAQSGPTYLNGATTVAHGVYGDLTINPDGTYTYTPNANYDALGAGVSATDVFKYGASDGNSAHGGFLTFHITGGNDPAVFTGIDTTGLTESNVAQSTGGTLVVNDVDGADTLVPQANAAGSNNYGVFNVNADGTWTYTMNSAHGEFVAGQTYTDKLTVHSADGTAHDLTVNILGTDNNHAPDLVNGTYGGTVTGQVHALPASALVNGSFESGGTGWTVASQAGGAAFSSNFPADGSGNFTANSFGQVTGIQTQLTQVVDTLPGLQYTLSFQVYTVSTTPGGHVFVNWNGTQVLAVATGQAIGGYHTFTATVTGTGHDTLQFAVDDPNNNPATYDSWRFDAVSLTPATHYEATSGTIAFSDADVSDVHSVTVTTPVGSNYIGNFVSTVDEATHQVKWTFYASDSALQALSSNSVDQTYTLKIDDGHGGFDTQNVTVTLAKHIDAAPVITSSAQAGFATEDASVGIVNLVQNPTFELPNIYNPVLTPWTVSGAGVAHIYGSGANGSVDAAYLDQNTTLSQTITTQIGTTYTIDFFMHNYGTPFSVSVNGTPVWTTSNVVPNWTEYSVTFTATSTSTVLSFATTGVNGADIDEVSVQAGTKHIVEGIETNAGTITYTDADLMDTHTVAASGPTFTWSGGSLSQAQITALTNASSLTLNATDSTGTGQGSVAWKHSIADSAIQFLNAGQTLTETYTVTIDDGQGGTTSQQVTITINGTNEPVAPTGQAGTLAITEDVTRVLTLSDFGYSDADGDVAAGVTITSLSISSSRGILLYGSSAVTANQFISAADIAAGMLSFAPKDNNFSGSGTFTFKVKDATGMSDATARTMTLAFDGTDRTDTTASGGSTDTTQVTLNSGYVSYFENGGSGDTLRINASSATTFTNLNFLQSSNNLEVGWSTSSATGYATLLDEYVFTSSSNNNTFESFQFQNGGSYLGYSLSSSAYVVSRAMTTTTAGMVIIAGSEAGDTISTLNSNGNNLLFGNGGSDTITGGFGNDLIVGGLGDDTLSGRNGSDAYVFGLADGNDTINDYWASNSDFDRIVIKTGGAAMSGLFAYDNDPNTFYGDLVIQYNGQQVTIQNHFYMNGFQVELINFDGGSVYGYNLGTSDYAIVNGLTADPSEVNGYRTISLSSGNNFVAGELDTANKITGGSGNDLIFGGDQSDILAGGNGNNLIVGGHGDDTLSAGTGNDVYAFGMTDGTDRITDVSGTDAIFIATHGAAMSMLTATDNNNGTTHGDLVIQYNGQQVTVMNHFDGGSSGANSIESIAFDGGSVYGYDLGTSSYAISNADPSNAGGARTIDLSASSAQNFIAGEDGAANVITGGGAKDLIFGGSQNDTLSGGAGNDLIQGGAGDDILMGGLGNDVLRGGSGADTFKFGAGHIGAANLDSILDFSNAEGDKIDISGLLDGIAGVQADGSNINNYVHLTQNGGNVLVQVDTTGAGNFSGNTHDVATLVGYGTSNADIVNMVFKNTDHSMTV